eukprot:6119074-Prymnesium_polylepis.1
MQQRQGPRSHRCPLLAPKAKLLTRQLQDGCHAELVSVRRPPAHQANALCDCASDALNQTNTAFTPLRPAAQRKQLHQPIRDTARAMSMQHGACAAK